MKLVNSFLLAFLLLALSKAQAYNIILITGDDHGIEMGAYGDEQAITPNLDALAAMGVLFEHGYVTQASCSPSRSSLLTGLYPHQHGGFGLSHRGYHMHPGLPNLVALLKQNGFRTGIIGKLHVEPSSGFPFDYEGIGGSHTQDVVGVFNNAKEFIDAAAKADEPFFLYLNYFDPHRPFDQPQIKGIPTELFDPATVKLLPFFPQDTPQMRKEVAAYYSAVQRLDHGIGLVIEDLKERELLDSTIIIYIGDNGPPFPRAKVTNYEAGVRVPFLIYFPKALANGSREQRFVSTVDLMPTILEAAGVEVPAGLAGRSLLPLLEGKPPADWRTTISTEFTSHTVPHYFPRRTIRDERYKLIVNLDSGRRSRANEGPWTMPEEGDPWRETMQTYIFPPRYELYDLKTDPYERYNLSADPSHADTLRRLEGLLQNWREQTADPTLDADYLRRLSERHAELAARKENWSPLEQEKRKEKP